MLFWSAFCVTVTTLSVPLFGCLLPISARITQIYSGLRITSLPTMETTLLAWFSKTFRTAAAILHRCFTISVADFRCPSLARIRSMSASVKLFPHGMIWKPFLTVRSPSSTSTSSILIIPSVSIFMTSTGPIFLSFISLSLRLQFRRSSLYVF